MRGHNIEDCFKKHPELRKPRAKARAEENHNMEAKIPPKGSKALTLEDLHKMPPESRSHYFAAMDSYAIHQQNQQSGAINYDSDNAMVNDTISDMNATLKK